MSSSSYSRTSSGSGPSPPGSNTKGPRGYEGPLIDGKPHGIGRQEYRDGSVFVGPFYKGIREGPGGQFNFSNGDSYVGQFKGGDKSGRGEYRWCDGSSYNGRWEHDKRCGAHEELTIAPLAGAALRDHFIFSFYGRFPKVADLLETVLGSEIQYRGGFLDDAVHGKGEMIFTCGATFEGSFMKGMEHGPCVLNIARGVRIEGEWFEGEVQTLVRVFIEGVYPSTGKPANMLVDSDVKEAVAHIHNLRGLQDDGSASPARFADTFTRSRQLAAQAAAEGVFGRPSKDLVRDFNPDSPMAATESASIADGGGGGGGGPISRAGKEGLVNAVNRMHHPQPISRAGYNQIDDGVANMRQPVPISRAGKEGLEKAIARMGEGNGWIVGGNAVEWVRSIQTDGAEHVSPNAWWRNHEHRDRLRMPQRPQPSPTVLWNTVGDMVSGSERQHEKQELRGERYKHDAEVDAVVSDPLNREEMLMLKDMPTRADVIQRIIDSATSKRKLVRCGIAVSLADCEVCSAFTNRVWWYLRTKMTEPPGGVVDKSMDNRRVVRVLDVAPGGVGEQWGLTRGDAVVAYCGFPAWEHTVLRKKTTKPGDSVSITVVRRTFDGDVEHANDYEPTSEPPTRMEEFASNERIIEKEATVGCNVTQEAWELLRSIPTTVKAAGSWMQDASWHDLKNLLKQVRQVNISARPEVWGGANNGVGSPPAEL